LANSAPWALLVARVPTARAPVVRPRTTRRQLTRARAPGVPWRRLCAQCHGRRRRRDDAARLWCALRGSRSSKGRSGKPCGSPQQHGHCTAGVNRRRRARRTRPSSGPRVRPATRAPAGASFCYVRDAPAPYEAQEVRAFGLLLADLVARLAPAAPAWPSPARTPAAERDPDAGGVALGGALAGVIGECLAAAPAQRPAFAALARRLERLAAVRGGACRTARLSADALPVCLGVTCTGE